jgi:hypothetical protein
MSVSAVSGSVQLFPPVQLKPQQPVNAPSSSDDASAAAAVQKQQDDNQNQQVSQAQQAQAQNNNVISVNLLV